MGRIPGEEEVKLITYEVKLRDDSQLPTNILTTEGRMRLLELLAPYLDVYNITLKSIDETTKKE